MPHRWRRVACSPDVAIMAVAGPDLVQDRACAAQCLHAKSDQNTGNPRLRLQPVAASPTRSLTPVGGSVVSAPWSKSPNRRTVLFLGRLHPVKGLARLVQAWAEVQRFAVRGQWSSGPTHETWQLILAGPDEGGHREEIESLVAECGCRDSVVFPGELDEKQKWGALAAADLFVMPSDFENFGNAIVEAMSCAVPVITTTGTPWEELRRAGAGWWVAPRVEPLAEALREALAMSETQRQEMGKRAAGLAARFSPQQAGADLIQVYRWLMNEIPRPPCVRDD